MSFRELMELLNRFDDERNWHGLDPADLAKSIVLESAELLEHFQWDNSLMAKKAKIPAKDLEEIGAEAADVLVYLMKFCREMEIDLAAATLKKVEKIGKKYPPKSPATPHQEGSWEHEEYLRIKKERRVQQ